MSLLTKLVERRGVRQFVKFALVGASGALVSFVVYHALLHFDVRREIAFAAGFMLGGVNNYWWNRHWTFRSKGHPWRELGQFLLVSGVALGISELALLGASFIVPLHIVFRNTVLWLIGTIVGMAWNFFVNKYWTFRHVHRDQPAPGAPSTTETAS